MSVISLADVHRTMKRIEDSPKQERFIAWPFKNNYLNRKQKREMKKQGYTYFYGLKILKDIRN